MAVTLSTLAEEILSKQERAVIRGIYRAAQLNEALVLLQKAKLSFNDHTNSSERTTDKDLMKSHVALLEQYLTDSIRIALVATKVPASSTRKVLDDKLKIA
jgi:hypothetical protein